MDFPKHDSSQMWSRFFGLVLFVWPGLVIGVHLASFYSLGKTLLKSKLVNRERRSFEIAHCIAPTIEYVTISFVESAHDYGFVCFFCDYYSKRITKVSESGG